MKFRVIGVMSLFLIVSIGFVSCSKDEEKEPDQPQQSTPNTLVTVPDADGVLVAIITRSTTDTPIGPMPMDIGTAAAVFYEGTPESFLDVGGVEINGSALSKQSNNSYVFMPGMTNPTGLELDDNVSWQVAGGNGYNAFSHSPSIGFPSVGEINSATTVTRSNGYTLSVGNLNGADSALFMVGGVTRMMAGNATTVTFSADDLSGLSAGTNVVQVTGIKYQGKNIEGKSIWFVNEKVVTKTATIE